MLIKEAFFLTATNTDILAAPSRLAAIPRAGSMMIECSASDCDGTNFGELTIQMPNGDIPLDQVAIPVWNDGGGADALLDTRTETSLTLQVQQGGHVLLQYTENGTVALFFIMVTLQF